MSILDVFWTLCNHSSVWFTSCLSIFYLLRIANISHLFFLWVKLKINRIILGILLVSLLISLIFNISLNDGSWHHFKVNHEENITWEFKVSKIPNAFKQITLNLGVILPFVLCLISFLLLLFSLFKHTKQIKFHATEFRDPSTEAHMRAIKAVIIFLLLFIMYYVAFLVVTSSLLIPQGKLAMMLGGIITVIFSSSHSFILIMRNSKLREAFLKVLRIFKCFHKRSTRRKKSSRTLSLLTIDCIHFYYMLLEIINNYHYSKISFVFLTCLILNLMLLLSHICFFVFIRKLSLNPMLIFSIA